MNEVGATRPPSSSPLIQVSTMWALRGPPRQLGTGLSVSGARFLRAPGLKSGAGEGAARTPAKRRAALLKPSDLIGHTRAARRLAGFRERLHRCPRASAREKSENRFKSPGVPILLAAACAARAGYRVDVSRRRQGLERTALARLGSTLRISARPSPRRTQHTDDPFAGCDRAARIAETEEDRR